MIYIYRFTGRSAIFESMFNEEKDPKEPILIDNTDSETFNEMLKFIYSGRVFNMEKVSLKLFEAASKVMQYIGSALFQLIAFFYL